MGPRVLVVEDEDAIGEAVVRALASQGYDAAREATGRAGLDTAARTRPDLVLLDLGLPDLDGVQVCRLLRADLPSTPIIVVTARDDDIDVVVGLDAGASDYVVKPFTTEVLLARVRAHLRQRNLGPSGERVVGPLRVDASAHRAYIDDAEIDLRPKEFALLVAMVDEAGRVMTRDRLLNEVWDLQWETSTKTLDMHVHALRRKLGERSDGRPWITTIRSVGYRFELM